MTILGVRYSMFISEVQVTEDKLPTAVVNPSGKFNKPMR
jgi:hypothetical protein